MAAIDSVAKKINFINLVKDELKLKNLKTFAQRAEIYHPKMPICCIQSSGRHIKNLGISKKHLKKDGFFIIYKGKNYEKELGEFEKKYGKKTQIIQYNLPTEECHKRFLITTQA